jgi:hypothetical protein
MSVEKARAALDAAKTLDMEPAGHDGLVPLRTVELHDRLLRIASVQAGVAEAEALERIAESLEAIQRKYVR